MKQKKLFVIICVLIIVLSVFLVSCKDKNQENTENTENTEQNVIDNGSSGGNNGGENSGSNGGNNNPGGGDSGNLEPEDPPEPVMTREEMQVAYRELFGAMVTSENPMISSVLSLFDSEEDYDGNPDVAVEQMTYYFIAAGITPYRVNKLLTDLQPIFDIFTDNQGASNAPMSLMDEFPIDKIKAPIEKLLIEGNIDIVCNAISKFIKDIPVEGVTKLLGANLMGIYTKDTSFAQYTESEYFALYGEDSDKIAALFDFENSVMQKFAQKDSTKNIINEVLQSVKIIVTDNRTEIKNILTKVDSLLETIEKIVEDEDFNKVIKPLSAYRPSKKRIIMELAMMIMEEYVPELKDVSLLNSLGKIITDNANYLKTTTFDKDLQDTITYLTAINGDKRFNENLTGAVSAVKAAGMILESIDVDGFKKTVDDVIVVMNMILEEDESPAALAATIGAACRVLVRVCNWAYPAYQQLDNNMKAIIERETAFLFAGAVDSNNKPITLGSMLAALGSAPLYEDLTDEQIANLTGKELLKYTHQDDALTYAMIIYTNYDKDDDEEEKDGLYLDEDIDDIIILFAEGATSKDDIVAAVSKHYFLIKEYKDDTLARLIYPGDWESLLSEDGWSAIVDTSKVGFTTLTLTHDDDSIVLNAYIVAANKENIFIDYYTDQVARTQFKLNEDIANSENDYNYYYKTAHIYDKETLTRLGDFCDGLDKTKIDKEVLQNAVDVTTKGVRVAYIVYESDLFGEMYYHFVYRVYNPENMQLTDIDVYFDDTLEIDDDYFDIYVHLEYEDFYNIGSSFTLERTENGYDIDPPSSSLYDINKFSISGFTFGQLGEQIVTATYDGCSYTSKVTTVEEKEDPHGGVK